MNPKRKGSAFEREVCRDLSLFVTGGKKRDCFWRSAMSGGRATVHLRKQMVGLPPALANVRQCGDVVCVSSDDGAIALVRDYYIECKHLKDIDIEAAFTGRGMLLKVWQKTKTEAEKYDKDPMLIIRQNRMPTLMCLVQAMRHTVLAIFPKQRLFIHDFAKVVKQPFHHLP